MGVQDGCGLGGLRGIGMGGRGVFPAMRWGGWSLMISGRVFSVVGCIGGYIRGMVHAPGLSFWFVGRGMMCVGWCGMLMSLVPDALVLCADMGFWVPDALSGVADVLLVWPDALSVRKYALSEPPDALVVSSDGLFCLK